MQIILTKIAPNLKLKCAVSAVSSVTLGMRKLRSNDVIIRPDAKKQNLRIFWLDRNEPEYGYIVPPTNVIRSKVRLRLFLNKTASFYAVGLEKSKNSATFRVGPCKSP
jgi:hypothetical protein